MDTFPLCQQVNKILTYINCVNMDSKPREMLGEHYIKSRLLKYDFEMHSELSYDKDGADFMITQKIDSNKLHFITIQSKSRKIKKSTNVKIPKKYVVENFVLFIYLLDENKNENLFCFFENDFNIFKERDSDYILNITHLKISHLQENYSFNQHKALRINGIFNELRRKKYTSIIIDGIFLEEALKETKKIYSDSNERKIEELSLNNLVDKIILGFNRFGDGLTNINCYVYVSKHHSLEDHIKIEDEDTDFESSEFSSRIFITYTKKLVSFEIMNDIDRFKQSDNIILIANDVIYEHFLANLDVDAKSIIIARLKITERPNEMYVKYRWGDISYPIGLALGLESYEL